MIPLPLPLLLLLVHSLLVTRVLVHSITIVSSEVVVLLAAAISPLTWIALEESEHLEREKTEEDPASEFDALRVR